MSVKTNNKESITKFIKFTIWKANLLSKGIHPRSVINFLSKSIWRTSLENGKHDITPENRSTFLYWFERAIDLFTKKDYVWQLDKTEGLVPYEESVRRIITFLVILSGISLVACTIMTIIVATSFAKETLELDILIHEQESSKKIQNIGT